MERCRRLIFILLAVAVAIPVVIQSRRSRNSLAPAALSVDPSARGYVRISGDVRHPGMYSSGVNMMTMDAISMAVPVTPIKVLEPTGIGATTVRSGEALQVHVHSGGSAFVTKGAMTAAECLVMGLPLDLNSISEADLDKVPGVGPALAGRIVTYRQNNGGHMSVQDLLFVEGVGGKTFDALKRYF